MPKHPLFRSGRIALTAAGMAALLGGSALAQTVRVFDDAPTIEQLRSIMIPESQPGTGRTIVMQRPDTTAAMPGNIQRAAAQAAPVVQAAAPAVEKAAPAEHKMAAAAPTPRPASDAKPGVVGMRINFAFDSAVLPDNAASMIDRVAQLMKESPDIKVRVEGHTDATGAPDYNLALSERRALSVGEYLVKMGIEPSRLVLEGRGMAEPLTRNPLDAENRRVQFVRVR